MPLISTKSLTLVLGVSLCGVSGYLLYQFLKNDDDEYQWGRPKSSTKYKISEIKVPNDCVRTIIGRNGLKIKQVQEQTNTKINFKDSKQNATERICVIKGSAEGCYLAEALISEMVFRQPAMVCESVLVPTQALGRIIGRCGENINEITNITGAQINIPEERKGPRQKIVFRGTKEQIALARCFIDEVVEKFHSTAASLAKREPRVPPKHPITAEAAKTLDSPLVEKLTATPGSTDSPFEVYVSAMIDPSRFWVQIVGPKAKELDLLVEEMTEYYRNTDNLDGHKLEAVSLGDLVAATFQYDNKWYRAEVINLVDNTQAELYYVDYGDTDVVAIDELYELKTDFLRLHFQAIECYLARVEPSGSSWSEEAVDKFEEWTHVAQWQKLSAKVNEYTVREKTRAKREGSPVPGVDLFDVMNDTDIDIAQELVRQGFAVYRKEKESSRSNSRATSLSNVSNLSAVSNSNTNNEST